jgi:alpha/beta superfamily hydrolase
MARYRNVIYFTHGKETGPEATKIRYLGEIARAKGFHVESPDYSAIPDPDERVKKLHDLGPAADNLVLAGSSMGAYISTVASQLLKPRGLFLLAPAFFLPGYREQSPHADAEITVIAHGWEDEVVPVENVIRFARQSNAELHLFDSDHRLVSVLPVIGELFGLFLDRVLQAPPP